MDMNGMDVRRKRAAGFSLTELLIVIVIIGILMGVVLSQVGVVGIAKNQKIKTDLKTLQMMLEQYRTDMGELPTSLDALVTNPGSSARWHPLMKQVPKDPWGQNYRYLNPGTHPGVEIDLYSIGEDRKEGTADDFGNWQL